MEVAIRPPIATLPFMPVSVGNPALSRPRYGQPGYWKRGNSEARLRDLKRLWGFARELQERATPAERALWAVLERDGELAPVWFQRPLDGFYIADFYLPRAKLVVELDGGYHYTPEQQYKDGKRDRTMRAQTRSVLRFDNEDVLQSLDATATTIRRRFRALLLIQAKQQKRARKAPPQTLKFTGERQCDQCGEWSHIPAALFTCYNCRKP